MLQPDDPMYRVFQKSANYGYKVGKKKKVHRALKIT